MASLTGKAIVRLEAEAFRLFSKYCLACLFSLVNKLPIQESALEETHDR
jgi:hypothetical protein